MGNAAAQASQGAPGHFFAREIARDARQHPWKYVFAAGEIGLSFTPLPEGYVAYEGAKAFGEAAFAAWHVAWEAEGK